MKSEQEKERYNMKREREKAVERTKAVSYCW